MVRHSPYKNWEKKYWQLNLLKVVPYLPGHLRAVLVFFVLSLIENPVYSVHPDQMQRYLVLHCFPRSLLWGTKHKWVNFLSFDNMVHVSVDTAVKIYSIWICENFNDLHTWIFKRIYKPLEPKCFSYYAEQNTGSVFFFVCACTFSHFTCVFMLILVFDQTL